MSMSLGPLSTLCGFRGIDVLSVPAAGMLGATDEEHLDFALREERVMYTQDTDFLRLHASGVAHAGIVYAPQGIRVGTAVRGLLLVRELLSEEDMHGHVEFL